jgi:hypothetical protein
LLIATTCKQFQYLSRPNGGAKARLLYRFMGDARKLAKTISTFFIFLPTSEELTQNLASQQQVLPSGVTGGITFTGYAT